MKYTAVEWLIEQLNKKGFAPVVTDEEIEQAKAMEKDQIIEAWMATDNPLQRMSAEAYYNETFNN